MTDLEPICSPVSTLSEVLDKYLAVRGVDKKKYYAKYLIVFAKIWQDIFQKTLWVTKSVWKELKSGTPYNYIDVPGDNVRIFSVAVTDECGNIQPLFYNEQLNIIPQPTVSKCGCQQCDCSGICEDINGTVLTTKEIFTVNGITYYEKQWIKYCKNGDILEYTETPTKKFNDFIGDGGDFNDDYNNDYDIGSNPLANFEIVTLTSQRKVCALKTRPCGCPETSEENEHIVQQFCGCLLPHFCNRRKKHCNQFIQNVNNNHYGEIKVSECGTRIYYKPNVSGRCPTPTKYPSWLLVNYQPNERKPNQESVVPDYAEMAMWTGSDWLSKKFNNSYSLVEKKQAEYDYVNETNKLIMYLNPLSLERIRNLQDIPQLW